MSCVFFSRIVLYFDIKFLTENLAQLMINYSFLIFFFFKHCCTLQCALTQLLYANWTHLFNGVLFPLNRHHFFAWLKHSFGDSWYNNRTQCERSHIVLMAANVWVSIGFFFFQVYISFVQDNEVLLNFTVIWEKRYLLVD